MPTDSPPPAGARALADSVGRPGALREIARHIRESVDEHPELGERVAVRMQRVLWPAVIQALEDAALRAGSVPASTPGETGVEDQEGRVLPPASPGSGLSGDAPHGSSSHATAIPSRGPADMRAVCDALGFDPENHHNAERCPYCNPNGWSLQPPLPPGYSSFDGTFHTLPPGSPDPWALSEEARARLAEIDQHTILSPGGLEGFCTRPPAPDATPPAMSNARTIVVARWGASADRSPQGGDAKGGSVHEGAVGRQAETPERSLPTDPPDPTSGRETETGRTG